ncbi:MAG: hypothetical protein M1814_004054 [Vezdaea aestivalis]|nr:MAG: hypothetical protein M1814_004054 [Vezdaea aestivalis]
MAANPSNQGFHTNLLRPSVLHIFRAAGFQSAKPAVVDTAVDVTARFLTLLAERTVAYSQNSANEIEPTISAVRLAMEELGCLAPSMDATEEARSGQEDLRGVTAFVDWCKSEQNLEIRRMAGMDSKDGSKVEVGGLGAGEDFLAALKRKTGKTGDESRYVGTVLGDANEESLARTVEGGDVLSIHGWPDQVRMAGNAPNWAIYDDSSESALSSLPEEIDDSVLDHSD